MRAREIRANICFGGMTYVEKAPIRMTLDDHSNETGFGFFDYDFDIAILAVDDTWQLVSETGKVIPIKIVSFDAHEVYFKCQKT